VPGKIGEVRNVTDKSFQGDRAGRHIEVLRAKFEDGKKVGGGELAKSGAIATGSLLGAEIEARKNYAGWGAAQAALSL